MTAAGAWVLGLHLISLHPDPDMTPVTPGVYVSTQAGPVRPVLGVLRNSEGRVGAYAGATVALGPLDLTAGVITGYQRRRVLPLLTPSLRLPAGPVSIRAALIPNPWGPWALHLAAERSF